MSRPWRDLPGRRPHAGFCRLQTAFNCGKIKTCEGWRLTFGGPGGFLQNGSAIREVSPTMPATDRVLAGGMGAHHGCFKQLAGESHPWARLTRSLQMTASEICRPMLKSPAFCDGPPVGGGRPRCDTATVGATSPTSPLSAGCQPLARQQHKARIVGDVVQSVHFEKF